MCQQSNLKENKRGRRQPQRIQIFNKRTKHCLQNHGISKAHRDLHINRVVEPSRINDDRENVRYWTTTESNLNSHEFDWSRPYQWKGRFQKSSWSSYTFRYDASSTQRIQIPQTLRCCSGGYASLRKKIRKTYDRVLREMRQTCSGCVSQHDSLEPHREKVGDGEIAWGYEKVGYSD